jgi:hypothetical protein
MTTTALHSIDQAIFVIETKCVHSELGNVYTVKMNVKSSEDSTEFVSFIFNMMWTLFIVFVTLKASDAFLSCPVTANVEHYAKYHSDDQIKKGEINWELNAYERVDEYIERFDCKACKKRVILKTKTWTAENIKMVLTVIGCDG